MKFLACIFTALTLCACANERQAFDLMAPTAMCFDGSVSYSPPSEGRCAYRGGVSRSLDGQRTRRTQP